jgi:8-oxo-dGTP pyrophosphatase MutT (NUDIX family)
MSAPEPRLAATVVLIRDRNGLEVLMVERHETAYFASALVFPGGLVDPEDSSSAWLEHMDGAEDLSDQERAVRIAGFRELYEETGVLIANPAGPVRPTAELSFIDTISRGGLRLNLGDMHPFAHWITPATSPKRYDTHFRLCAAETDAVAASDGRETVSVEWIRPDDALRLGAEGARKLLFPTRMNLQLLAQSSSVREAIAAARTRTVVTVTPTVERRAGGVYIVIPPDAGYGPAEEFAGAAAFPQSQTR